MSSVVDFHAHIFPLHIPDLTRETGDARWPRLERDAEGPRGEVKLGEKVFRVVTEPLWDTAARVAVMDQERVDVQVVSPMPLALTYWGDAQLALRYARAFNDAIAAAVRESNGRLRGLGTVPLQDAALAVEEMKRCMGELGLHGLEIGTIVGRAELDHGSLRPFFEAAADDHVPIFIHPIDGSGATRCSSPLIDFAIGMHTDTSLTGYALVYGGVLEALPDLRICLSHGGGAFPWTHPRLRVLDKRDNAVLDALVRRLWADALVFDPLHLSLLKERFGAEHLMLGSDQPFITTAMHDPKSMLRTAHEMGILNDREHAAVMGTNALKFLER